MSTGRVSSRKRNGIVCTENVRAMKSITSFSATVDSLVNTREKVSHTRVFIRTESKSPYWFTVESMTIKNELNINFCTDMVLHWSAWDQLNYQNSTKKRSYWIPDHDISWKRTTHATTWASPKRKIPHLLWIKIQRPISRPKTVSIPTEFSFSSFEVRSRFGFVDQKLKYFFVLRFWFWTSSQSIATHKKYSYSLICEIYSFKKKKKTNSNRTQNKKQLS